MKSELSTSGFQGVHKEGGWSTSRLHKWGWGISGLRRGGLGLGVKRWLCQGGGHIGVKG